MCLVHSLQVWGSRSQWVQGRLPGWVPTSVIGRGLQEGPYLLLPASLTPGSGRGMVFQCLPCANASGGLSPQTATAAILRLLAVLLHTQDMLDPSFLLPSPQRRGPADGHPSSIIQPNLCVIVSLWESWLQKKWMIKEKTERLRDREWQSARERWRDWGQGRD